MKAIATLNHLDDVSGTTIFDDGAKAYWTEGRSSDVVIIEPGSDKYPMGMWHTLPNGRVWPERMRKYQEILDGIEYGNQRRMTWGEQQEHEWARNWGGR